jgi:ubiquinone/menaquinone biosynthesis C-methylase UbiE
MWWIWLLLAVLILGIASWWLVNSTEGVYLGRRAVIWLYDRYATRYDTVKSRQPVYEYAFLARPLLHYVDTSSPHVLDVATGTGRLPVTLFEHRAFGGSIVALDLSHQMLNVAATRLQAPIADGRLTLLHMDATTLHFPDNSFDVVTCLEALEFLPDAHLTLAEMVRVVRPGGILTLTNRQGADAWLFLKRTMPNAAFTAMLEARYNLTVLSLNADWSDLYALVWLQKTGNAAPVGPTLLEDCWCCPACGHIAMYTDGQRWRCNHCGTSYPQTVTGIVQTGD